MDKKELLTLVAKFGNIRFRMGRTQFYDTHESHNTRAKEIYTQITEALELPTTSAPASAPYQLYDMHSWQFHYLGSDYRVQGPKVNIECLQAMFDKLMLKQPIDFTDREYVVKINRAATTLESLKYTYLNGEWRAPKTVRVHPMSKSTPFKRNYGALMQAISEQKNSAEIMKRAIELLDADGVDDDNI